MELDALVTQDNSQTGIWREVQVYGKRWGFELCILGADADAVQKFNRNQMKEIRRATGNQELDDETVDRILDSNLENVLIRMVGIRSKEPDDGVILLGKPIENNDASYRFLLTKIPAIKDFVLKVSGERTNFLPVRKKN
jgi:hypothetical protein